MRRGCRGETPFLSRPRSLPDIRRFALISLVHAIDHEEHSGYGKEPEAAAMEKKADLVLAKPVKMTKLKTFIETLLVDSERENDS